MHVWLNGEMVDSASAQVPIDDHGLVVGDGIFETMRTEQGRAFAVRRHLTRLRRGLSALAIPAPEESTLRGAIDECVAASGLTDARIRLTITGGSGSLGSGAPTGDPNVIVAVTPLRREPPVPHAITVEWTRNERGALAGLKTTSYAENVRALRLAHESGASESIFPNTVGDLCEGTGTNVFVVVDGECITPPLSAGCLAGVTREILVDRAEISERNLPIDVLTTADEVFLTSTTRDVQGLTRVDDRVLEVGPVTEKLRATFAAIAADEIDP